MNKTAVKNFAVWARTTLISAVEQKAFEYDITPDSASETKAAATTAGDRLLTDTEKNQRDQLVKAISEKGFEQVMEETAYTWFNRFTALRFMEVNGYLPSHIRVFTDEENNFKPQILAEAIHLEMEGLDMNKVYELRQAEKNEELYKYLLITQCNELNSVLPKMFQKIDDCTELLLPDNLLREGSVIEQMVTQIPEEDWKDEVQIIGWLYQYYISQKKELIYENLNKNIKVTKENIPSITQWFTPNWIVCYMIENSLGRMWLEGHPDSKAQFLPTEEEQKAYLAKRNGENSSENAEGCTYANYGSSDKKWHYYLEEAKQEQEVQEKLDELRKQYAAITPEDIKVIDPCCGSGHILAYMFDVLMQIYESSGYTAREAASSIVENNLYGLDIDGRAAQLAYFSVMMKGCQYDRRFLKRGVQPRVYEIEESNHTDPNLVEYFSGGSAELKTVMNKIVYELKDAKEYGSILNVSRQDWNAVYARFAEIENSIDLYREAALAKLLPLAQVAEVMSEKYNVVVTNPPYLGIRKIKSLINEYVKKNYVESKHDLYAVFIDRCLSYCQKDGIISMVTPESWFFIPSFAELRKDILSNNMILSINHMEKGGFDVGFATSAFVIRKKEGINYKTNSVKLRSKNIEYEFLYNISNKLLYSNVSQRQLLSLPSSQIAYWISDNVIALFLNKRNIGDYGRTRQGMATSNNKRFLRFWFEVDFNKIDFNCLECGSSIKKWFPYNKGGGYRKWYGTAAYVINWEDDGREVKKYAADKYGSYTRTIKNISEYFKRAIAWPYISSSDKFGARIQPEGFIFDVAGSSLFTSKEMELYLCGLLSSKVAIELLKVINPTTNYQTGDISRIPVIVDEKDVVDSYVSENVTLSKYEWDTYELSWDFKINPLINKSSLLKVAYENYENRFKEYVNRIKFNEMKLNEIFIKMYKLEGEVDISISSSDITIRDISLVNEIKNLISYAVGCIFGRYSLDKIGIAYAGGTWDSNVYKKIAPDKDNIIPICEDDYFEDDITNRFIDFIRVVYGVETLEENLQFIANALGGKGSSREIIRNYFVKDFFSDHCKMYEKHPIYWQFDSGKKNGFKALIYMHRYEPDLLARMRTDYVHEQQERYCTQIEMLENEILNSQTSIKTELNNKIKKLKSKLEELKGYEEKIHHLADKMILINLDDGVEENYSKFKNVLAKIK